jgi:heptaprenyl diphosphate synthase
MKKIEKLAFLAMTAAIAIVLSFVESQIPAFFTIPGVKLGLANVAIIFALYKMGFFEAVTVSLIRIFTVFLIFGGVMPLLYSLAGAVLSLAVMYVLKRSTPLSEIGVSVSGGVAHNIAQVTVAAFLFDSNALYLYLPVLLLSGTVAGVLIGIASAVLVKRVNIKKYG